MVEGNEQGVTTIYKVVVNQEDHYSIWPENKENALGWKVAGKSGNKSECLEYTSDVWTDLKPLGLRQLMDAVSS